MRRRRDVSRMTPTLSIARHVVIVAERLPARGDPGGTARDNVMANGPPSSIAVHHQGGQIDAMAVFCRESVGDRVIWFLYVSRFTFTVNLSFEYSKSELSIRTVSI